MLNNQKPLIMGILNVTPDSFYDGGEFDACEKAVKRAEEMIEEGADIIDIGGESTGPGSGDVSVEEELKRVIPVVEGIRYQVLGIRLSVDTYKATVARAALEVGATMINDISAGRFDPEMFNVIAKAGCDYVMMHTKDHSGRTTIDERRYENVIKTIHHFFEERIAAAEAAGIKRENIIIDPGLGHFISSDPKYSWEVLERLDELSDLGCRILVSPSRKSFTAEHSDQPPTKRLPGTLKATEMAVRNGAVIIRTHDVGETKRCLEV